MTRYSVDILVKDAKVAIDENVDSTPLAELGDTDTLKLDDIIKSKVEDAARLVTERAAHWLLDEGDALEGDITWEGQQPGKGAGFIDLPQDFLRLVTFQMTDWLRPVTDVITEDSPLYALQSSRYGGVRGNVQKPVVAITHSGNGPSGMRLEFYSCTGGLGAVVKRARYIKVPTIGNDDKIRISEKLYRAVVYRIASLTALEVGAGDLAAAMLKTSMDLSGEEVTS